VNLPLAGRIAAMQMHMFLHILQRSESVSKMCAFLEILDLGSHIEDEEDV
jgi:hypothetical protein